MLSFDADWMSREQIVSTTYEVGAGLNDLKFESGLVDEKTHATVALHLQTAVRVLAQVQALQGLPERERLPQLSQLEAELTLANTSSLVGEDELNWRTSTGIRVSAVLLRRLATALSRETGHAWSRLRGRYDTAVATPDCLGSTASQPPETPTRSLAAA